MNALVKEEHHKDPARAQAWRAYQGVSPTLLDEKELIERYLPLVRRVVDRIKLSLPAHVSADDLYSVGVTGLIAAVRRYDPDQGNTFSSYATTRVRGAILDYLRQEDWCPRRTRAKARQVKAAVNALEQRLGRPAMESEIAAELKISLVEYAQLLDETRPVTFLPLDRPADSEASGESTLHDTLPDTHDITGREVMEKEELVALLTQRIGQLPDIPRKVLAMYYFENMRLAEIAEVFGLTESRICQIHSQAILSLRAYLQRARDR